MSQKDTIEWWVTVLDDLARDIDAGVPLPGEIAAALARVNGAAARRVRLADTPPEKSGA